MNYNIQMNYEIRMNYYHIKHIKINDCFFLENMNYDIEID